MHIKKIILIGLLICSLTSHAQDNLFKLSVDTTWTLDFTKLGPIFSLSSFSGYIYHSPNKKDYQRYKLYKPLIAQQPTAKNHGLYFSLACSLWHLQKIAGAKKMFLTIVNSKDKFYTASYYHSSDVPGDKSTNKYGYGSFTSNYKNYAAIYLTKIYLEQKKYDSALLFLEDAVNKYKVTYSCGTGFNRQKDESEFLYASCYQGLNRDKDVVDLLLPSCLERYDDMIVASIKKSYSTKEIQDSLLKAEQSMEFVLDTFPSYAWTTHDYGTKKERTDTIRYFSGLATITLFGKQVTMRNLHLENGEYATKKKFIAVFKESNFYTKIKEDS